MAGKKRIDKIAEKAELELEQGAQVRRTTAATVAKLPETMGLKRVGSGMEILTVEGEAILHTIRLQGLGGRRADAILAGLVHFGMRAPRVATTGLELIHMILRLNAAAAGGGV